MKVKIGENILLLRLKHNMSQKDLAWKMFKNESVVRAWEQGVNTPSIMALVSIAKIFGVTLDELVLNVKDKELRER